MIPFGFMVPEYGNSAGLDAPDEQIVKLRTAWSVNHARPGDSIVLAVEADIKEGFHINADPRQVKSIKNLIE